MKLTFQQLSIELVLTESQQDIVDVALVFIKVSWVDQDVIKVDNDTDIKKVFQQFIDIALEHHRHISESKWHDQVLIVAVSGVKCHLPFIPSTDPNAVISVTKIQLCEKHGAGNPVY